MNTIPHIVSEGDIDGVKYIRFDFFPNSENAGRQADFTGLLEDSLEDPDHFVITLNEDKSPRSVSLSLRMLQAIKEHFNAGS